MKFRALLALGAIAMIGATAIQAQQARQLSIATGGTGGIYYPLAGGFGSIIAKEIPGITATAEVTGGSLDNMKLIGSGNADVAFTQVDTAVDAINGIDKFPKKLPIRALAVMYVNLMQVVTLEGNGITKFEDLKGKRISTGSPGSGTEIFALRLIEAAGMDKDKDMTRERLSAAESANALKDRKIDAFMFVAGVPTSAITDVAASPGIKMMLIDHAHVVAKVAEKYGPAYSTSVIPEGCLSQSGQRKQSCQRVEHHGRQRRFFPGSGLPADQDHVREACGSGSGSQRSSQHQDREPEGGECGDSLASGCPEVLRREGHQGKLRPLARTTKR